MWWRSLFWLAGLMVLSGHARAQMAQPPTTPVPTTDQVDSRLLSPSFAESAPPPTTSLKTFACTAKTLAMDTTCVFIGEAEALPNIDRRATHAKKAEDLARALCEDRIGKPCSTPTTAIHVACRLARSPTDAHGRFLAEASDCYAAMREHFDQAQAESTFTDCCQCAATCGDATGCSKTKTPTLVGMCIQTCATACGRGGRQ